jgi:hypothetical protein
LACCGKKRAADRLARGQSQPQPLLSPSPAPPAPVVRAVKPRPPAPVSLATPRNLFPVSPQIATRSEVPAPSIAATHSGPTRLEHPALEHPVSEHTSEVEFQYIGSGRLTVIGPVTGAVYYFSAGGETISVHSADAPSLIPVPGLKVIS